MTTSALSNEIRFSAYAWTKLLFLCQRADTEIGCMGIAGTTNPLFITDVALIKQESSVVSVEFDDGDYSSFVLKYGDPEGEYKLKPTHYQRVWIHTHPAGGATPSLTDERTFDSKFGPPDWAVMAILSKSGEFTARLRMTSPSLSISMPLRKEVDFSLPSPACDFTAWAEELKVKVSQRQWSILSSLPVDVGWERDFPAEGRCLSPKVHHSTKKFDVDKIETVSLPGKVEQGTPKAFKRFQCKESVAGNKGLNNFRKDNKAAKAPAKQAPPPKYSSKLMEEMEEFGYDLSHMDANGGVFVSCPVVGDKTKILPFAMAYQLYIDDKEQEYFNDDLESLDDELWLRASTRLPGELVKTDDGVFRAEYLHEIDKSREVFLTLPEVNVVEDFLSGAVDLEEAMKELPVLETSPIGFNLSDDEILGNTIVQDWDDPSAYRSPADEVNSLVAQAYASELSVPQPDTEEVNAAILNGGNDVEGR